MTYYPPFETMTLSDVQPYWVLKRVSPDRLPEIAYNDLLAGNESNAVMAVVVAERDRWELNRVVPRAFAALGLPPLTEEEAARRIARELLEGIVSKRILPLDGAYAVHELLLQGPEVPGVDGFTFSGLADEVEMGNEDPQVILEYATEALDLLG